MAKATLNKQISVNVELSEEEATKVLYAISLLKTCNFDSFDSDAARAERVLANVVFAIKEALRNA